MDYMDRFHPLPVSGGEEEECTVSSLSSVHQGDFKYLFFVIDGPGYASPIRDQMETQISTFGQELGRSALVVRVHHQESRYVFEYEVLEKEWPPEVIDQIENETDPFILVTDEQFDTFDPRDSPWGILWMSGLKAGPQSLSRIFHKLSRLARDDDGRVFEYLDKLGKTQRVKRFA